MSIAQTNMKIMEDDGTSDLGELSLSKMNSTMTRIDLNQTMTSVKFKAKDQFEREFKAGSTFKLKKMFGEPKIVS